MKKKLSAVIMALGGALVSLPLLVAFEARVINVTAQIEDGVITVPREVTYGTVFPQQKLDQTFDISLSQSFLSEPVGNQCASSVVAVAQGKRKDGTAVLANRSDPTKAQGSPQSSGAAFDSPVIAGSFFSLGFGSENTPGGSITLGFTNFVVNTPGTDLKIYEITGGPPYPDEKVQVEVSQDNISWTNLGTFTKDSDVDINPLFWIKYIRLIDMSDKSIFPPDADGYDLDAVCGNSRTRVGIVNYVIRQKPKCANDLDPSVHPEVMSDQSGAFHCPVGSTMMPLLCPYLSKNEIEDPEENPDNDGPGINAFHGLPLPWTEATAASTDAQVYGVLSSIISDVKDTWDVDLKVPCFVGECAQDWPNFVKTESANPDINPELYKADPTLKGETFGCDLWVEVTDVL